jgi:hypothetical protein
MAMWKLIRHVKTPKVRDHAVRSPLLPTPPARKIRSLVPAVFCILNLCLPYVPLPLSTRAPSFAGTFGQNPAFNLTPKLSVLTPK